MVTKQETKKPAKKEPKAKRAPSPKAPVTAAEPRKMHRRMMTGVVVSDKMQKTIVVKIDRRVRHSLYKKYLISSMKFKAHDEKNTAKVGDLVEIIESRPLSRDKRWALQRIVRRDGEAVKLQGI